MLEDPLRTKTTTTIKPYSVKILALVFRVYENGLGHLNVFLKKLTIDETIQDIQEPVPKIASGAPKRDRNM